MELKIKKNICHLFLYYGIYMKNIIFFIFVMVITNIYDKYIFEDIFVSNKKNSSLFLFFF